MIDYLFDVLRCIDYTSEMERRPSSQKRNYTHMTIKEILWILLFRYIVIKTIFFNCRFFPSIIHVPGVLRVFLLSFFLIWVVVVFFFALLILFLFFSLVTYQVLVQLIKLIVLEDFDAARHDVIKPSATLGNESVSAQKKN